MAAAKDSRMWPRVVGRDVEGRDSIDVANATVGDDSHCTANLCAEGENVADCARALLPACLDDENIVDSERIECSLLGVVATAELLEEVFAIRDEPERARRSNHSGFRSGRGQPVDGDVVVAKLAQLRA